MSDKVTCVLYSDRFGFMLLLCLVIDLWSVIKTRDQPKIVHHFDSVLLINLDSKTHFLCWFLDISQSCAFAKTYNPQGECILLHKIEIHVHKVAQ